MKITLYQSFSKWLNCFFVLFETLIIFKTFSKHFETFSKHFRNFPKPVDSCTNQLISIMHEIYPYFGDGFEVRGVFLDMSKAFDKVWYNGLIYKLKQNEVAGDLLDTLTNFL